MTDLTFGFAHPFDPDEDFTAVGELDCVADQVREDLAQASRVALE